MVDSTLLALINSTITDTAGIGWHKFVVMSICNVLALFVLSRAIWHPHVGPKMPLPFASVFNNLSVPAFLACMSAGHLLGAFTILALTTSKAL